MSLRWSSYVAPKSPKGGLKNVKRPISVYNRTSLEESLLQSFFVWKLSAQSCKAFIGLTNCAKMTGGGATPCIWNFRSNRPRWSEIADFRFLLARSDSVVTPTEKSSINTNRKSTTPFPMSPRWTSYVVPKPPKGGSKTQGVQNLNNKLR